MDFARLCPLRRKATARPFKTGVYSMQELAGHFVVHYSTVSRVVRRLEPGRGSDTDLRTYRAPGCLIAGPDPVVPSELIPYDNPSYRFGYDDPRRYFPAELVALLDEALPPTEGWEVLWLTRCFQRNARAGVALLSTGTGINAGEGGEQGGTCFGVERVHCVLADRRLIFLRYPEMRCMFLSYI